MVIITVSWDNICIQISKHPPPFEPLNHIYLTHVTCPLKLAISAISLNRSPKLFKNLVKRPWGYAICKWFSSMYRTFGCWLWIIAYWLKLYPEELRSKTVLITWHGYIIDNGHLEQNKTWLNDDFVPLRLSSRGIDIVNQEKWLHKYDKHNS